MSDLLDAYDAPRPFPARTQEARGQCAPVVSHRRGSKLCTVIEGEVVR
ncbi:hypothetical protein [Pseudoroseomonas sp. WGS1072]